MGLVSQKAEEQDHQQGLSCPDCKQALQATMALSFCPHCRFPLLEIAGKYRLEALLAQGGYGAVYLACHMRLSHFPERVIKIIKPELLALPTIRERFHREVQITARLAQESPHIVHVYDDFGECPRLGYYYVMEYLKGISLRDRINAVDGPLPIATIAHIFAQLTEAIQSAHDAQILHRDLKPENLLLIEKHGDIDFLKVVDFGIAKPLGDEHVSLGITLGPIGTPAYMAPEQCLHRNLDERTDIYALGTILYELLTGVTPFPWDTSGPPAEPTVQDLLHAQIHQHPPPLYLRASRETFVQALEDVVQRALAKAPHKRYASVSAMWEELQPALALQAEHSPVLHLTAASLPGPWIAPTHEPAPTPAPKQPKRNAPAPTAAAPVLAGTSPLADAEKDASPAQGLSGNTDPKASDVPKASNVSKLSDISERSETSDISETMEPPVPSEASAIVQAPAQHPSRWLVIAALALVVGAGSWWAIDGIADRHVPVPPLARSSAPQIKRKQPPNRNAHAAAREGRTSAVATQAHVRSPKLAPPESKQKRQAPVSREMVIKRLHQRALIRQRQAFKAGKHKRARRHVHTLRSQPRRRHQTRQLGQRYHRYHDGVRSQTRRRHRPHRQRLSPKRPRTRAGRWVKGCPKTSLYWVFAQFPDATQRNAVRPVLPPGGRAIKSGEGICFGVKKAHMHIVFGHSAHGFVPCHLFPARSAASVRIQLLKEGDGLEPDSRQYCIRGD